MAHPPITESQLHPPTVELGRLDSIGGQIVLLRAREEHLPGLVRLLADDELGLGRETAVVDETYRRAFDEIDQDPHQLMLVGVAGCEPVAMVQLSLLWGLSRHGALRAQLEGVRVADSLRGTGVGTALLQWVIDYARVRGASLVQLTTDRRRAEAHGFYSRLGFVDSHLGLKLEL